MGKGRFRDAGQKRHAGRRQRPGQQARGLGQPGPQRLRLGLGHLRAVVQQLAQTRAQPRLCPQALRAFNFGQQKGIRAQRIKIKLRQHPWRAHHRRKRAGTTGMKGPDLGCATAAPFGVYDAPFRQFSGLAIGRQHLQRLGNARGRPRENPKGIEAGRKRHHTVQRQAPLPDLQTVYTAIGRGDPYRSHGVAAQRGIDKTGSHRRR